MRMFLSGVILLAVVGILFFMQTRSISANKPLLHEEASGNPDGSFAVVELFTSEGCSSCPPADRLLTEIVDEARAKGRPVYGLSFHVDYWNYIGWTDPYSDKKFSDRQRQYAEAFNSARIYTPQMVVNGQTEFVGSNASKAKSSITNAMSQTPDASIRLASIERDQGEITVRYETDQPPVNFIVNLALVERGLIQDVRRGENSGKQLRHDNVVRAFSSSRRPQGEVILRFPDEVNIGRSSVIAYVQDARSFAIVAATAQDLDGKDS